MTSPHRMRRRTLLAGASSFAACAVLIRATGSSAYTGTDPASPNHVARFLDQVSEAVLPGSGAQAPGHFISFAAGKGWRSLLPHHIEIVMTYLNSAQEVSFTDLSHLRQTEAVKTLDADAYAGVVSVDLAAAWKILKQAILSTFFTTETGAADTLVYDLVPGVWRPDIPVAEAMPAMSNDWLAVWFT